MSVKGYKFPVIKRMSSGALMYNMVIQLTILYHKLKGCYTVDTKHLHCLNVMFKH